MYIIQTDKQKTDRHRETQSDRQVDRQAERESQSHRQTGRERESVRQTDRQREKRVSTNHALSIPKLLKRVVLYQPKFEV